MIEIIRITTKYTNLYEYKKVYFKSGLYNMCYREYYDFFLKKKKIAWLKEKTTYRGDIDREYKEYISYNFDKDRQEKFFEELKKYKFRIRGNKLKRLL